MLRNKIGELKKINNKCKLYASISHTSAALAQGYVFTHDLISFFLAQCSCHAQFPRITICSECAQITTDHTSLSFDIESNHGNRRRNWSHTKGNHRSHRNTPTTATLRDRQRIVYAQCTQGIRDPFQSVGGFGEIWIATANQSKFTLNGTMHLAGWWFLLFLCCAFDAETSFGQRYRQGKDGWWFRARIVDRNQKSSTVEWKL